MQKHTVQYRYIIMADVIESRKKHAGRLMSEFKDVVETVNAKYSDQFLSPLTITLGDEFQGIVGSLEIAAETVINLEEIRVQKGYTFRLRYVIYWGEIATEINQSRAYEMLGEGLTKAREMLARHKKNNAERVFIKLAYKYDNKKTQQALHDAFTLYFAIVEDWKEERDYQLISAFWELEDYKKVAERLGKDISLMWRREKSLKINEYIATKRIIHFVCKQHQIMEHQANN